MLQKIKIKYDSEDIALTAQKLGTIKYRKNIPEIMAPRSPVISATLFPSRFANINATPDAYA